jgi:hypothetical protein
VCTVCAVLYLVHMLAIPSREEELDSWTRCISTAADTDMSGGTSVWCMAYAMRKRTQCVQYCT